MALLSTTLAPSLSWQAKVHQLFQDSPKFENDFQLSNSKLGPLSKHQLREFLLKIPDPLGKEKPSNIISERPTTTSTSREKNHAPNVYVSYSNNQDSSEFRAKTFHWGSLDKTRSDNHVTDRRKDDGVVLLVGLFNLFAVVVYAAQQLLSNKLSSDKRIIFWQVEKVLDELVLRVHSSDTAANLLSRAFKSSFKKSSMGRDLNKHAISSFLLDLINEKDPIKLGNTLNTIKDNLLKEVSHPVVGRGPKLDPRIYEPLENLYRKLTLPTRRGRAFETSLLQEVNMVAKTASEMSLEQLQNVLRTLKQLGKMRRHYDVVSVLKHFVPTKINNPKTEPNFAIPKVFHQRRLKRQAVNMRNFNRNNWHYLHNRRAPRYSKALLRYKAKRIREMHDQNRRQLVRTQRAQKRPRRLQKRQGIVETVVQPTSINNWADGWFTLLTQAAPVALDISTLYTKSKKEPFCLRALLCQANRYWKKRGTFQAALSPFLSVLASWAVENQSPHSLGDSLIAVRAGWMRKSCHALYPGCSMSGIPHPLAEQAMLLFNMDNMKPQSSTFSAKSGEVTLDEEPKIPLKPQTRHRPPPPPMTTTPHTTSSSTTTRPPVTEADVPLHHSSHNWGHSDNVPYESRPYDRYDQPVLPPDQEALPSGSVSGMDLQDRPLDANRNALRAEEFYDEMILEGGQHQERPEPEVTKVDRMGTSDEMHFEALSAGGNDYTEKGEKYSERDQHDQKQKESIAYNKASHPILRNPSFEVKQQYMSKDDAHKWHKMDGPKILHHSNYSTYMKSQQPAFIPKEKETPPTSKPTRPSFILHKKTEPPLRKVTKLKYRYGLRRGLPAKNVDGHSPLLETSFNSYTKPQKLKATKSNQYSKKSSPLSELPKQHLKFPSTTTTTTTSSPTLEKNPKSTDNPLAGKHVFEFRPEDAVTDPLRNDLLFQYIRDRHFSPNSS